MARRSNWFVGVLSIAALAGIAYYWSGVAEDAKRKRAENAKKVRIAVERDKAEREKRCAVVTEALEVVTARGRGDLAAANRGVEACQRIFVEDCGYAVELLYELTLAGRSALAQQIGKLGEDCGGELEFATKHGLTAFRDHRKLLVGAVERALDEQSQRTADDYEPPPDIDYRAR